MPPTANATQERNMKMNTVGTELSKTLGNDPGVLVASTVHVARTPRFEEPTS